MQHAPPPGRLAVVATLTIALLVPLASSNAMDTEVGRPTAAVDPETLVRHWQASVAAYTLLTRREPDNGLAWFRLGTAHEQLANPSGAVAAFTRAEALGFEPVASRFHVAVNRALLDARAGAKRQRPPEPSKAAKESFAAPTAPVRAVTATPVEPVILPFVVPCLPAVDETLGRGER